MVSGKLLILLAIASLADACWRHRTGQYEDSSPDAHDSRTVIIALYVNELALRCLWIAALRHLRLIMRRHARQFSPIQRPPMVLSTVHGFEVPI